MLNSFTQKYLHNQYNCEFDDNGNIGTPYCLTIDFETLENNTLTIRQRDTMQQERIAIDKIFEHLK